MRAAIVTTLTSTGAPLLSFVAYHLRIGFEHLYLFYEGVPDEALQRVLSHPQVTVISNGKTLEEDWRSLRSYEAVCRFLKSEVMARQILNAELAIHLAASEGMHWLLHIDADELLLLGERSLQEHFECATASGATQVVYLNHEAVPECDEVPNYFKDVTLFKANPETSVAGKRALFFAYVTGKAAVRVDALPLPLGVHRFRFSGDTGRTLRSRSCHILHYPSCGLTRFLEKYRSLGAFGEHWFGQVHIPTAMDFHWQARTLITNGRLAEAQQLYARRVMLAQVSEQTKKEMLSTGALLRITGPSSLLAQLSPGDVTRTRAFAR